MKLKPFHLLLLALLVASLGWGAAASGPFAFIGKLQTWLSGGVYIGASATGSTDNKVTTSAGCGATAVGTIVMDGGTIAPMGTCTATGAVSGDVCVVGLPATSADGGTEHLTIPVRYVCSVSAADTVKIWAVNQSATNNQTVQMSVRARTFSNQ